MTKDSIAEFLGIDPNPNFDYSEDLTKYSDGKNYGIFMNKRHTEESKDKIRKARLGKSYLTENGRREIIKFNKTDENRKKKIKSALTGLTKSESHRKKISEGLLNRSASSIPRGYKRKSVQIWISNGIKNTRINKELPIPEGWYRGRI